MVNMGINFYYHILYSMRKYTNPLKFSQGYASISFLYYVGHQYPIAARLP